MKKTAWMMLCLLLVGCGPNTPPTNHTITFNSNEGSDVADVEGLHGSIINEPAAPTKEHHDFDGWYRDVTLDTPVVFPHTIVGDETFHAKWEIHTFTITWVSESNILETDNAVPYGSAPVYNGLTPAKVASVETEYSFAGWSPEITMVTENTVYTAQFVETPRQYSIYFESNGGNTIDPITDDYGTSVDEPAEPIRAGFDFMGWCSDQALTSEVTWPLVLNRNYNLYAAWNERVDYREYLPALFATYEADPYSFIPESMQSGFNQLANEPELDFSSFVNVADIPYGGHGEQWQMVLDNLKQSEIFFNVLSVIDIVGSFSVAAFNNYLDSNQSDKANYSFLEGEYSVVIRCASGQIDYSLSYTKDLPILGEQEIQITLSYNLVTHEKEGRIQLGDANALRYVITDDSFTFAIKYLGVRRAFFEIAKDEDDRIEGRIFEYLGVDDVFSKCSAPNSTLTTNLLRWWAIRPLGCLAGRGPLMNYTKLVLASY